jgi:PTH1 family peptidyl-tRNA hydrolase
VDGDDTTRFVVGLGNPGRKYARTRHNVGWMVLAELGRRWGVAGGPRKAFGGELYDVRRPSGRAMLFAPHTYMNRSGEAVKGLLAFYKASPAKLLVVMDEMALPQGVIRARAKGSAGGHNGLADVLRLLETPEVPRLRVGIGAPPGPVDPVHYVLGKFDKKEMERMVPAIETAADAVETWLAEGIRTVMDRYNRKAGSGESEPPRED